MRESIEDGTPLDWVCKHKMPKPDQDPILFIYCEGAGGNLVAATNVVFLARDTAIQRVLIMEDGPNDSEITECIHTNLPGIEDDDTDCTQYRVDTQEGMGILMEPYIAFTEN